MPQAQIGGGMARLRSFPPAPAPNDDPTTVKGNLSLENARLMQNILAYHIGDSTKKVFGYQQGQGVKLVEAYVRSRTGGDKPISELQKAKWDDLQGVTVVEMPVTDIMLNAHGTLSGACTVLVVDLSTFSALFALTSIKDVDSSGFSTAMNLIWHGPAVPGQTLRFVSTTMSYKGRVSSVQCEAFDKKKGTLIMSATHLIAPVQGLPVTTAAPSAHAKL